MIYSSADCSVCVCVCVCVCVWLAFYRMVTIISSMNSTDIQCNMYSHMYTYMYMYIMGLGPAIDIALGA